MPVKYVKLYKDNAWLKVESGRVERFLELGWTQEPKKESLSKDKISVSAEVTSSKSEDPIEDWDPLSGEDWADSQESMKVDDELPEDEEN